METIIIYMPSGNWTHVFTTEGDHCIAKPGNNNEAQVNEIRMCLVMISVRAAICQKPAFLAFPRIQLLFHLGFIMAGRSMCFHESSLLSSPQIESHCAKKTGTQSRITILRNTADVVFWRRVIVPRKCPTDFTVAQFCRRWSSCLIQSSGNQHIQILSRQGMPIISSRSELECLIKLTEYLRWDQFKSNDDEIEVQDKALQYADGTRMED